MKRTHACLLILILALAAAFIVRLFVGVRFGWPAGDVLDLRLGRVVSAAAVGAGLGVSGALLQALLRNPLASPFILGLANGAGLGVVVAIWIGYAVDNPVLRQSAILPAALLGALLALVLVLQLGRRRGQVEPLSLVLVGVVLSAVFGAVTLFVLHLLPPAEMAVLTRWMMGSISDERSWLLIGLIAGATVLGAGFATALARPIDAMMLGDEDAVSVGVPLQRLRRALLLLAGVLAA
ncbi:MAG: iron chelate uptake ABC transporter family permease subunit, partial [Phycisphaerales bacterium JB039]